jgi:DNA-binding CsgD family transcriptional regulator
LLSKDQMIGGMDVMNACLKARNEEDIEDIWLSMQSLCNIDGMMLSVAESFKKNDIEASGSTYQYGIDAGWRDKYLGENFASIDPVVRYCSVVQDVFRWNESFDYFGSEVEEFAQTAAKYGLKDGYAIGQTIHQITHTASITSVSMDASYLDDAQHFMIRQLLPHVNAILSRPGFLQSPSITKKEREVLQWASQAKSYWEIGTIMGITERTVKFHFNNIFRKLRVNNREQAVKKSVILGLIQ